MKITLPNTSGTYILLLYLRKRTYITVGYLGLIPFTRGWYAYVGSAFGPGGLAARLSRHLRQEKKYRWHIDYLRAAATPKQIWYSEADESLEHLWADNLLGAKGLPIVGFGCSDCRCPSHLFYFSRRPGHIMQGLKVTCLKLPPRQWQSPSDFQTC